MIVQDADEVFYRMNCGVHRFSSMVVLSIVQSAGLGNNLSKPNQYTEIEYLGQYSVCKFFLILSQWIMWALLQKNEGTAGRDTIYLAAPEDRTWSEGISRPGRCVHGDSY